MEAVALKMLEEGKILNKHEYDNCLTTPIRSALVLNHFGSWTRLVSLIEKDMPHVIAEIKAKSNIPEVGKISVDKPVVEKPKVDPLEALAKSNKPA